MENNDPKTQAEVKDPIGVLGWPEEKGRDGERTPMQWDARLHAGFSRVTPWLPVPAKGPKRSVGVERADPSSILNLYKRLLALRRWHDALRSGTYVPLLPNDPNVLAYLRRTKDSAVLVALNMSTSIPTLRNVLAGQDLKSTTGRVLVGTLLPANRVVPLDALTLRPFEVVIADVGPGR